MIKQIALAVIGLLLITILSWKLYQSNKSLDETREAFSQYTGEANLELGRAKSIIADANYAISALREDIQEEIKARKQVLDMYAIALAKLKAKGSGTLETPDNIVIPKELISLPFKFKDWRLEASGDAITKKFEYSLTQQFEVQMAESVSSDKKQYNHYIELYELDPAGKRVNKLELTKFNVVRTSDVAKNRFYYKNPRIDVGAGPIFGPNITTSPSITIGISPFSYGLTPSDSIWKFGRIGFHYSPEVAAISIAPVQYNIGKPLPVLDNLWITPTVGMSGLEKQDIIGSVNLTVGL